MNTLKRILSAVLCLALMSLCLTGCHKKGEIAVVIGDVEFSSGYYACSLVFADTQARSKVEEGLSEEEAKEEIDYYKQKVEDTDYVEWVENTALETLKKLAAVKALCKQDGFELDAETVSTAKSNADYLWKTAGYSALLEANGVSAETFNQYMIDSYLTSEYFEHIYGKGGEKEIAADKLLEQMQNNYALVNIIEVSTSSLEDDAKTEKQNQLNSYETALKSGAKTFEEVYLEYNGISADEHTHEEAEEGETQPLDPHATVIGGEDTDYSSDYYEDAKAMAAGEIKVITKDDSIALVVKKDIVADPYYLENLDIALRNDIAGDDFEDDIKGYGEKLKCDINKSATGQFKVKKLVYPESGK